MNSSGRSTLQISKKKSDTTISFNILLLLPLDDWLHISNQQSHFNKKEEQKFFKMSQDKIKWRVEEQETQKFTLKKREPTGKASKATKQSEECVF